MWWSHQSMQALGLMHLQQPENFGIYAKSCFAILKITPWQLTAQIQVRVFCPHDQAALLIAEQVTRCCDAHSILDMAGWIPLRGYFYQCKSHQSRSMRYPCSRKRALHKLVQVFSIKETVQVRVTYFTSFHFTSPSGNNQTLLLKATGSHGNF